MRPLSRARPGIGPFRVGSDEDDLEESRWSFPSLSCHFETTEVGNLHVDENHVGLVLACQPDRVFATIALGEQMDVVLLREQSNQSIAGQSVGVADNNADSLLHGFFPLLVLDCSMMRGCSAHRSGPNEV